MDKYTTKALEQLIGDMKTYIAHIEESTHNLGAALTEVNKLFDKLKNEKL